MEQRIIEVTKKIKVHGFSDQALLDHLGRMTEGDYREMYGVGAATPNDTDYEETEMELVSIDCQFVEIPKTETLEDWFSTVNDSKAFLINEKVCHDFSFPSPDDETDTNYAFNFYGPKGSLMEVDIDPDFIECMKLVGPKEVTILTKDGQNYSLRALS